MSDHDIAVLLRDRARPAAPSDQFGDDLFDLLVGQIDFELGVPRQRETVRRRWAGRSDWHLILLIAAAIVLLLFAVVSVASIPKHPPIDAVELVRHSESAMLNSPPFDMTVEYDGSTIRYQFAAERRLLRAEVLSGSPGGRPVGAAFVFDGRTYYEFGPDGAFRGAFSAIDHSGVRYGAALGWWRPLHPTARTWPLAADLLAWPALGDQAPPTLPDCSSAEWIGVETIARHESDHVRCDSVEFQGDYWIDRSSGLLLKVAPAFAEPATAIGIQDRPEATTFKVQIPTGPRGETPFEGDAMTAGTYATTKFAVPFTMTLDDGWSTDYDWEAAGRLGGPDRSRMTWALPLHTFDPNTGANTPVSVASSRAFVDYFTAHHPDDYENLVETTFAGHSGYEWDVDLKPGTACAVDAKTCDLVSPQIVWHARTVALDVVGRVVILNYAATDGARMDRARRLLETVNFS